MRLIAKVIRVSHAKFHCNRLTTVRDIQDYASLIFFAHSVETVGVDRSSADLPGFSSLNEFVVDCWS